MAALIKQIEFGNVIVTISAGMHCMETCVRRRRGLLGSGALVQGVFSEADLVDLVRAVRLAYHFVKRDDAIGAQRGSPLYTRSSIVRGPGDMRNLKWDAFLQRLP